MRSETSRSSAPAGAEGVAAIVVMAGDRSGRPRPHSRPPGYGETWWNFANDGGGVAPEVVTTGAGATAVGATGAGSTGAGATGAAAGRA